MGASGVRDPLPVALEESELDALLRAARESSPRDLALVTLMAYAGVRISEAITLRWRDVTEDHVFIRRGKGGRQRLVDTHRRVLAALEGLDRGYKSAVLYPDAFIFAGRGSPHLSRGGAHKLMGRLCAAAGIPPDKAHCHSLRHTFAVRLLRANIDLVTIRDLLGHSSVKVTEKYLRLASETRRAAVDALS